MKMKHQFIILIICSIIIISCPPAEFYSEYNGINLIAGVSMSQWDPDQNTSYMNYQSTGYAPPGGSGEVYRLEIINLMPNGDFNAGVGGWQLQNLGGGSDDFDTTDDVYAISGDTLYFNMDHPSDRIDFDLRDAVNGITDGFIQGCSYTVKFDYRADPNIIFSYHDDDGTDDIGEFHWKVWGGVNGSTTNPSFNNIVEFPPENIYGNFPEMTIGADLNHYFSFGSLDSDLQKTDHEGYIDNYKVIRTDIPLRLRLAIDSGDTTEPLISGSYRFSVYVKLDPAAGTNNRFASKKVCLRISGGNNSKYASFTHGTDGNWSGWQRLAVDIFIQFPAGNEEIELSICPADDSYGALYMDAGSILISEPSLEFFADGF